MFLKTKLSVNLNKVALLRNQRDLNYPSVVNIARMIVNAGAHGITVHPRPDQRHTRDSDVRELSEMLKTEFQNKIEFNVEGYPTEDFLALVSEVMPTQVTLVPDAPDQKTSDHGWDLAAHGESLKTVIAKLNAAGSRVSLFLDPEEDAVSRASDIGAQRIELYTEPYASAFAKSDFESELERYSKAAKVATQRKLEVNAGHDLTLDNLPTFKQKIPMLAEVSIGHAITADALEVGFPAAVKAYLAALE